MTLVIVLANEHTKKFNIFKFSSGHILWWEIEVAILELVFTKQKNDVINIECIIKR